MSMCQYIYNVTLFTVTYAVLGDMKKPKKAFPIAPRGYISKMANDACVNCMTLYVPTDGSSPPMLITACNDDTVKLWDLSTAKLINSLEHPDWVSCVAVYNPPDDSSNPPMVVAGCYDGSASVWNLTTQKKIFDLENQHDDAVLCCAVYSPPARDISPPLVITGSADKSAVAWNLVDGTPVSAVNYIPH